MAVMDELGSGSWCASAPGGACRVSGHQYFSLAAVKINHMCDKPVCKFIDRVCKEGSWSLVRKGKWRKREQEWAELAFKGALVLVCRLAQPHTHVHRLCSDGGPQGWLGVCLGIDKCILPDDGGQANIIPEC